MKRRSINTKRVLGISMKNTVFSELISAIFIQHPYQKKTKKGGR
jgi:hypothetical protein